MKAVCVGHSTFDITLPVSEFPKENKKYRIRDHIECGGGPASNAAYLLAKWGLDTSIVSIIGNDYYGQKVLEEYEKVNIDTTYLEKRDDYMTSNSYIITNMSNASRTVLTSKKASIKKLNRDVNIQADIILLDGEHPDTAIEVLNNNPNTISILDAGRLNDDVRELGKRVTYLACSKDFAEEFCNEKISNENIVQLTKIHQKLASYFKTNIIITLEATGVFTKINDEYKIISSIKVQALDTTGAGDIFHGALAYFIGNNYPLEEAIKYSCITGAISVTRIGSRNSIPMLQEVLDHENAL